MKLRWKTGIGIAVLVALFAVAYSILFLCVMTENMTLQSPQTHQANKVMANKALAHKALALAHKTPPTPPTKNSPLGNVDKLLNEMEFGVIAFNSPTNINIDDSPQIQLLLSLASTVEALKQSIAEEGEKVGATIKVSDIMEARLSGDMFQITEIIPIVQAISKSLETKWEWKVHPKKEGKHKLHLTLTALLEIDGRSTPRTIRTFDKVIEVNVTATQKIILFFKNNWQWLWAAILLPVGGWLWKR